MNNVLRLINNIFTLRTCRYDLSEDNIAKGKFKVCLEYHIGNCKGPCEGLQTEADYLKDVDQAVNILKGNLSIPKQYFREAMQEAASNLEFEQAQKFKEKLELVDNFQSRSVVVSPKLTDLDKSILKGTKNQLLQFIANSDPETLDNLIREFVLRLP